MIYTSDMQVTDLKRLCEVAERLAECSGNADMAPRLRQHFATVVAEIQARQNSLQRFAIVTPCRLTER